MSKPTILCKLQKGKFLGAFPGFVDTFNWIVDFCNNLRGDADNGTTGDVRLDRSDSSHPVIIGTPPDGESIEKKYGKMQLKGFDNAYQNAIPYVSSNGSTSSIGWIAPEMTPPDNGSVLMCNAGGEFEWKPLNTINVLTKSVYNTSTRTFTNYYKTVSVVGDIGEETAASPVVFTATPHNVG